jgi:hypothetical protein
MGSPRRWISFVASLRRKADCYEIKQIKAENETTIGIVMDNDEVRDDAAYREAGRAAVRLLKTLAELIPLRSDTPEIKKEIARLEKVLGDKSAAD